MPTPGLDPERIRLEEVRSRTHQTGWTSVVARLAQLLYLDAGRVVGAGKQQVAHDPNQLTEVDATHKMVAGS